MEHAGRAGPGDVYQLAIPAPKPQDGSFIMDAAERGQEIFNGKGKCAGCHVPPLYTEPGNNLHAPSEVGVDSSQGDRSSTHMYPHRAAGGIVEPRERWVLS